MIKLNWWWCIFLSQVLGILVWILYYFDVVLPIFGNFLVQLFWLFWFIRLSRKFKKELILEYSSKRSKIITVAVNFISELMLFLLTIFQIVNLVGSVYTLVYIPNKIPKNCSKERCVITTYDAFTDSRNYYCVESKAPLLYLKINDGTGLQWLKGEC